MLFTDFDLHPKILKAVESCGLVNPTPVQEHAIPHVLEGRDVLATAATGTGKTAAFLLPTMSRILAENEINGRKPGTPAILVLTPTRELASQVSRSVRDFGKFMRMANMEIVGGVPYRDQLRRLSRPVEVVVATPGRLLDHMRGGKLDLSQVGALVLDEADRMLDMGFSDDVEAISKACPFARQTLLFTATMDKRMEALANGLLKNPARVSIETRLSAPDIKQSIYHADDYRHKRALLGHFLNREDVTKSIVFVATKREADELCTVLGEEGHSVGALHGDMSQGHRNRTLRRLVDNRLNILIATDVAARGIDVKDISHVINFDLPRATEDYVHRIGRTGRAGATGEAISLVGSDDHSLVIRIERFTKSTLEVETVEGLEPQLPIRGPSSRPSKRPKRSGPRQHVKSFGDKGPRKANGSGKPSAKTFGKGKPGGAKFTDKPRSKPANNNGEAVAQNRDSKPDNVAAFSKAKPRKFDGKRAEGKFDAKKPEAKFEGKPFRKSESKPGKAKFAAGPAFKGKKKFAKGGESMRKRAS